MADLGPRSARPTRSVAAPVQITERRTTDATDPCRGRSILPTNARRPERNLPRPAPKFPNASARNPGPRGLPPAHGAPLRPAPPKFSPPTLFASTRASHTRERERGSPPTPPHSPRAPPAPEGDLGRNGGRPAARFAPPNPTPPPRLATPSEGFGPVATAREAGGLGGEATAPPCFPSDSASPLSAQSWNPR